MQLKVLPRNRVESIGSPSTQSYIHVKLGAVWFPKGRLRQRYKYLRAIYLSMSSQASPYLSPYQGFFLYILELISTTLTNKPQKKLLWQELVNTNLFTKANSRTIISGFTKIMISRTCVIGFKTFRQKNLRILSVRKQFIFALSMHSISLTLIPLKKFPFFLPPKTFRLAQEE